MCIMVEHRRSVEHGELLGKYDLVTIQKPDSPFMVEIAAIDALVFPGKSLSVEGFRKFVSNGGVLFCHVDRINSEVVSSCSLQTKPDPEATSERERSLPNLIGYCDAAAVAPGHRQQGLHRELLRKREAYARSINMRGLIAAVYSWNIPSMRSLLDSDFFINDRKQRFYDDQPDSSMLMAVRDFKRPNPGKNISSELIQHAIDRSLIEPLDVTSKSTQLDDIIAFRIRYGVPDTRRDDTIDWLVHNGYVGVLCERTGDNEGGLIFANENVLFTGEENDD